MQEAREAGRRAFIEDNGFGYASTYLLLVDGELYDPKAIVGVAHGFVHDRDRLQANEFDATEAVDRLRKLDYDVVAFNGLWWVNQSATYAEERAGGFVWAPQAGKNGRPVPHHVAVSKLRVGQKIVHCANGTIRSVGTVVEPPRSEAKPSQLGGEWADKGYLCPVAFRDLVPSVSKNDVPNRAPEVGPFDINGNLKQAYLTKVADAETFPLLEFLLKRQPDLFDPISDDERPDLSVFDSQRASTMDDNPLIKLLVSAKNIVLEGVPGTGKTYAMEAIARGWTAATARPLLEVHGQAFLTTVMHPSTSYEDFIEGLRPALGQQKTTEAHHFDEAVSGDAQFKLDDGFFLRACQEAVRHPDHDVLVLLDELNRCNISSVLGDLLLSLEASKRGRYVGPVGATPTAKNWTAPVHTTLPYSRRLFFVPDNVYVVATTNTTDRSVAPLDAAIRRRFSFVRLEPEFADLRIRAVELGPSGRQAHEASIDSVGQLNDEVLGPCVGPDAMLGQSYLYGMHDRLAASASPDGERAVVREVWRYQILPQLIESLRAHAAEDLLDTATRTEWLTDHHVHDAANRAEQTLRAFDSFLEGIGLGVVVDGTGLTRGARVVETMPATPRLDVVSSDTLQLDVEAEGVLPQSVPER
jgi:hypothetical protein